MSEVEKFTPAEALTSPEGLGKILFNSELLRSITFSAKVLDPERFKELIS